MIHVVFGSSAAGTLRQLLRARGVRQRVVDLQDCLHWGPISGGRFNSRVDWFDRTLPLKIGDHRWLDQQAAEFCLRVEADNDRLIWIAPRSTSEMCGLYWYLAQFGGAGAHMMIADYPLHGWKESPPALGTLDEKAMGELLDTTLRPWDDLRFPADRWFELMAEDALLRILDAGRLRSVPEDFFDDFIWQQSPGYPTKLLRVVGNILAASFDLENTLDDGFIIWRLRELILQGKIHCDGALPRWDSVAEETTMLQRVE